MKRSFLSVIGICALIVGLYTTHLFTQTATAPMTTVTLLDSLHLSGTHIINQNGQTVFLQGVDISGEYLCPPSQMYSLTQLQAAKTWNINAIKLTINPELWLAGYGSCTATQYQASIQTAISNARSLGLYVIAAAYEWDKTPQDGMDMATATTQQFWQVFAPLYAGDTGVLYETFNEPHNITATQWLNGDTSLGYIGEQQLANTIRNTGAQNIIIIDGDNYGGTIGQLLPQYALTGTNIAYAEHLWTNGSNLYPSNWPANWENAAATYPIIGTEFGDNSSNCAYLSWLPGAMTAFTQHADGMFAWAFNTDGTICGRPDVINPNDSVSSYGQPIYQFYTASAPSPTPTPIPPTATVAPPTATPSPSPTSTPPPVSGSCTTTYTYTATTMTITTVCLNVP